MQIINSLLINFLSLNNVKHLKHFSENFEKPRDVTKYQSRLKTRDALIKFSISDSNKLASIRHIKCMRMASCPSGVYPFIPRFKELKTEVEKEKRRRCSEYIPIFRVFMMQMFAFFFNMFCRNTISAKKHSVLYVKREQSA